MSCHLVATKSRKPVPIGPCVACDAQGRLLYGKNAPRALLSQGPTWPAAFRLSLRRWGNTRCRSDVTD